MLLNIGLILLAVIILVVIVFALLAWRKPEALAPLGQFLMRSKKMQSLIGDRLAQQLGDDPQMLQELASQHLNKEQSKQLDKVLANYNPEERKQMFTDIMQAENSGKKLRPEDLARRAPRNADEARSKNKKKSKTRSKAKAAKKQRKRQRKN